MLFNKCSLLIPFFPFIAILYRYLLFIYSFTIYSFLRIFLLLLLQIISLEGRRNFLSPPLPPLNLILSNFHPGIFIQIMASISRPLKTYLLYPLWQKESAVAGLAHFQKGFQQRSAPGLSLRAKAEGKYIVRGVHGRATTTERRTNERKSICMIHARERGRLEGGSKGQGYAGVGIYVRWKAVGEAIEGKGERRATLLPSCSLLPRTKGTERAVCAINTRNSIQAHEEGYSYNATPSVTRSVVSRVPYSLRTFMALLVAILVSSRSSNLFPLSVFSLVSFPYDISGIYASYNIGGRGEGKGSEGFHRMRRRRLADTNSSARSLMIPRLWFDFENWYIDIFGGSKYLQCTGVYSGDCLC